MKPKFANPEDLWEACCEYFEWVQSTPLLEAKLITHGARSRLEDVPHIRAMTVGGLCIFLDVSMVQWIKWKDIRPDLVNVIAIVEETIRSQKFEGAAAGMLNANIIARDLGLADKKEIGGPDGRPVAFVVTVPGVTDIGTSDPDNAASAD